MKLIFIGSHFYFESGTQMSSIYNEDGEYCSWSIVTSALENGEEVSIRQATRIERKYYEEMLSSIKAKRIEDKEASLMRNRMFQK